MLYSKKHRSTRNDAERLAENSPLPSGADGPQTLMIDSINSRRHQLRCTLFSLCLSERAPNLPRRLALLVLGLLENPRQIATPHFVHVARKGGLCTGRPGSVRPINQNASRIGWPFAIGSNKLREGCLGDHPTQAARKRPEPRIAARQSHAYKHRTATRVAVAIVQVLFASQVWLPRRQCPVWDKHEAREFLQFCQKFKSRIE
jgi:hypothetical protein